MKLRIRNLTRQTDLAVAAELADSRTKRRQGLLNRPPLAPGEGLWLVPCEAVHTFFMKFPIDLVYIDRERTVRKVRHAVQPWRVSACFSAHSVIELPAGAARASGAAKGDRLQIAET